MLHGVVVVVEVSKVDKPVVMDYLARIVRHFDVIAIQEVRSKAQDVLPTFVDKINETGDYNDDIEASIKAALEKFKETGTW